jgi:outer membrane protein OmpA-like peptidoglycan-associated protein/opacity protein-like surface antigen
MKRILLFAAVMAFLHTVAQAQVEGNTPFLGLKAGANFSSFKLGGDNPKNYKSGTRVGFAGGLFGNIPIAKRWAFQPEVLYSQMGGSVDRGQVLGDLNQRFSNLSVPVMLKYFAGSDIRLLAGAQADIVLQAKGNTGGDPDKTNTDDFKRDHFALTAGAEYWPSYNFGIGARYIYGLNDITEGANMSMRNRGVHAYISYRFGKKPVPYVAPPPPPPVVTDRDNDGIPDTDDKCPDVPGLAKYNGCPIPDTDKDGINDENDKCPTVPGLAKYSGCPIPDTDKDGINDEEDKCPTVAGLARYQGCPIPDSDNDGINDEEDKCPTIAGVPENFGCPKINFNAAAIQFLTGSCTLTTGAKTELNKAVKILNEQYTDIKVSIEGHTDNTGKADKNQTLSECRAAAVKAYLVGKKVAGDRLSVSGFGQDKPIADNATKEGKAKNRRVEFKVSQ